MYRCWVAHSFVIRLGSIAPSSRRYCFRINTSVCLISRPSVHFGQNRLSVVDFTSFISWSARGDGFNSADISNTFPFCSTLTGIVQDRTSHRMMKRKKRKKNSFQLNEKAWTRHNLNTNVIVRISNRIRFFPSTYFLSRPMLMWLKWTECAG